MGPVVGPGLFLLTGSLYYCLYLLYPTVKREWDDFKLLQHDETVYNHPESYAMYANWTDTWTSILTGNESTIGITEKQLGAKIASPSSAPPPPSRALLLRRRRRRPPMHSRSVPWPDQSYD